MPLQSVPLYSHASFGYRNLVAPNLLNLGSVYIQTVPGDMGPWCMLVSEAGAAVEYWLGFDPQGESPDIPVSAFAVDGRKASTDTVAGTAGGASGTADKGAVAGASAATSASVSAESESVACSVGRATTLAAAGLSSKTDSVSERNSLRDWPESDTLSSSKAVLLGCVFDTSWL